MSLVEPGTLASRSKLPINVASAGSKAAVLAGASVVVESGSVVLPSTLFVDVAVVDESFVVGLVVSSDVLDVSAVVVEASGESAQPVSYTHLTLPTICSV